MRPRYGILFGVRMSLAWLLRAWCGQVGQVPRGASAAKENEEVEVATSGTGHPHVKGAVGATGAYHPRRKKVVPGGVFSLTAGNAEIVRRQVLHPPQTVRGQTFQFLKAPTGAAGAKAGGAAV